MKTLSCESMVFRHGWLTFAMALLLPGWVLAGTSNSLLDISSDGKLLVSANRDNGTVSIVDLATHKVLSEVPVGHKPESATFVGRGPLVAVTAYADDKILLIDTNDKKVVAEIPVFDEPYGIVSNADGSRLYATLEYPGQVVEIDVPTRAIARTLSAGEFPRGIALSERENRLYVSGYYNGTVLALDLQSGEIADRWDGLPADNLARQIAVHPTRAKAYLPHIRSRVRVNQGEGSIVPFLTVIDTKPGQDRRRNPIPMDSFYSTFVVANPWEAAISPDGKRFGVVFAGTDDMYVCDVVDDDYREIAFKKVLRLGKNPRAIRFTPDSRRFYVYDTLDFEVVEFDADSLRPTARIPVCENPLGDELLLGKVLFYSALQPMVGRRWISCASCHPDGDGDARTWQNPEGLRNTTALHGMAWTHPIHWSADRDEAQDFEHTIRSQLMQGKGLISGRVSPSLEGPNKGKSPELDALSAYSNSHKFSLSPHAKQGLSESAQRGKALFFSKETGCATCHSGPFYSDSTPALPFKLHDVGTGADDKSEKMGPKYDTPTLLGLYRTAPYLHHGRAKTLEDVLTTCNPDDKHGHTKQLSKEQVADLVEFLKSLPYEDPEAAAQAAGMTKIDR
jgi:YVTN family beta-propeller protein